ncbi:MAG: ribosome recycling factor [Candidatus Acididesulfobacter guangdongensis]|uniref:Ribosome-recycling factor n=1 Tax=Acididesulfobacter guangdongensis TaxID=2597225 RepID=A0A519BF36_ACIG2|nr:MAG: ribosome recycling factor [Candidatus Acididesulfobacter guangdongensis]
MDENELISVLTKDMIKAVEAYRNELSRIRTGRASAALVDNVKVEYFGALSPLIRLATVSIPESRTIMINPYDISSLASIEKAIQKHDPSLNPSNNGKSITILIPQLTEERRRDINKQISKMLESMKQELRNIRRAANDKIKSAEKEKAIEEDKSFKLQKKVQEITDSYIEEITKITKAKEKDIMEI